MIRQGEQKDVDTCAKLLIDKFNDEPFNEIWTPETARIKIESSLGSKGFLYIAQEDGEIKGFVQGQETCGQRGRELYMEYIIVTETSKGIGSQLFEKVEELAKNKGIKILLLDVLNECPAHKYWRSKGFKETGNIIMKKPL